MLKIQLTIQLLLDFQLTTRCMVLSSLGMLSVLQTQVIICLLPTLTNILKEKLFWFLQEEHLQPT